VKLQLVVIIEQIPGNSTLKKNNQILINVNILQGLIVKDFLEGSGDVSVSV